ncbi:MAG: aspartyl/asparaginyl beta-hydroxylase domain-containing protein [Candidatus Binatia bacterium]
MEPPYLRIFGDYTPSAPIFATRDECPWLERAEAAWRDVRSEVENYRRGLAEGVRASFVPDDVDIRGWDAINFVSYLHWYPRNCEAFPKTLALLRSIPDLTTAYVSILAPGAGLPVHNGDTNTTYRCHLGLVVPPGDDDALGLEVGGERVGWREGEAFAFNEAPRHFVWNRTDRERIVLVFDVLRPQYRARKLRICGDVLGAMTLTMLETKMPPLRRLPDGGRRALHRALSVGASAVLLTRDRAARA